MPADSSATPDDKRFETAIIDIVIQLAFLGLLAYWAGLLIAPFVILVIWAVILAVAIYPMYVWLRERLGGRGKLASFVITLIGLAIILGPMVMLLTNLAETVQELSHKVQNGTLTIVPPPVIVQDWPIVGDKAFVLWQSASSNLSGFVNTHSATILSVSGSVAASVAGVGGGILGFAASIIIAGFLFGNGPIYVKSITRFASRVASTRGKNSFIWPALRSATCHAG